MPLGRNADKRMSTNELNESVSILRRSMSDRETRILKVLRRIASPQSSWLARIPKDLSLMIPASAALKIPGRHGLARNFPRRSHS